MQIQREFECTSYMSSNELLGKIFHVTWVTQQNYKLRYRGIRADRGEPGTTRERTGLLVGPAVRCRNRII